MKTSESVKLLIESKEEKQAIKTGNWKAIKEDNEIDIYYYNTLVGTYTIELKNCIVLYDYSISTKCGLTKIINLLKRYKLLNKLIYATRDFKIIKQEQL